ncbi:MAG: radical SAM protein [Elusimicrobia bacterium]|nr:radical SAM protein [Elusimicrobiota bacterium]
MPADDAPGTVHFGLDLTYACNYACPYCALPPVLKHRSVAEWTRAWERVHRKYGRCYIYMSGGEPSIYPGFYELIEAITPMHTIDLCTNLSWDVDRLIPATAQDRFKVSATFHPTQVPIEEFLPKAIRVRDYFPQRFPPRRSVYFVADPKQMGRMEEYSAMFERDGLVLVPLPLMVGNAPGNTEEENRSIEAVSPNKDTPDHKLEYQLRSLSPRGKLCRAGQRYAHIRGDGLVDRCTRYEDRQLGDFFSEDFELFSEPKACTQEWCPFESQWLVPERELAGPGARP